MRNSLLFYDNPLLIQPKLAVIIGLNESIVVQQLHYWIEKSKHIIEGKKWVYNTYSDWQAQFPFFSESTVRRVIKKLEDSGIVISSKYNKMKADNTKWYTLDYRVIEEIEKNYFEKEKGAELQIEQATCSDCSEELLNLDRPIPETTTETDPIKKNKENAMDKEDGVKALYDFYSTRIHLPSPLEYEKIKNLQREFTNLELVKKAIEIAVEKNAKNLRYIEVVLYDWKEKGIDTVEKAEAYIQNMKGEKQKYDRSSSRIHDKNSKYHRETSNTSKGKWEAFKPTKPECGDGDSSDLI